MRLTTEGDSAEPRLMQPESAKSPRLLRRCASFAESEDYFTICNGRALAILRNAASSAGL
jgi:hypothetical protein